MTSGVDASCVSLMQLIGNGLFDALIDPSPQFVKFLRALPQDQLASPGEETLQQWQEFLTEPSFRDATVVSTPHSQAPPGVSMEAVISPAGRCGHGVAHNGCLMHGGRSR